MAWHLPQRFHAWRHGLFRTSDEVETRECYERLLACFADQRLDPATAQYTISVRAAERACEELDLSLHHPQGINVRILSDEVLASGGHFVLPQIDWSERRSVTAWWELRDILNAKRKLVEKTPEIETLLANMLVYAFSRLLSGCAALRDTKVPKEGISVATSLIHSHTRLAEAVEGCVNVAIDGEVRDAGLIPELTHIVERNIVAISGGNPDDVAGFTRTPKLPTALDEKDPEKLVQHYLAGTPFLPLFDQAVTFTIPQATRFEHHHIVAGSGHGKTQTLQYLIANDLPAVAAGRQSVIVLDSQGDLIRNISGLKEFVPGGSLHDRVVIIDPTDVEYPVSLNLFDVGMERLQAYPLLERERLTNSILELYDFVLGTLLSAEMTQKQNVIFRYVTRLMLHIPDATIHTLRELMEPGSEVKFAGDIAKLEGTAKHFFETEFTSREFEQTKKQVLRRLWGILENQTFERMFSHPRSKLDLYAEMNAGKIILINTAKDLLKETGSQIFGRFFIALIAQAAQERATLKAEDRKPTIVYIDEAADYFDRNIGLILAQARKYKVGMVLAHQYLGQLDPKLQDAFAANTAIKFAGGVSQKDARSLAPMLHTTAELIEGQPKGSFAASVRGRGDGAVPLAFPLGHLEDLPRMERTERQELRRRMRERYAVHYTELQRPADEPKSDEAAEPETQPAAKKSAPKPFPPKQYRPKTRKAAQPQSQTKAVAKPPKKPKPKPDTEPKKRKTKTPGQPSTEAGDTW